MFIKFGSFREMFIKFGSFREMFQSNSANCLKGQRRNEAAKKELSSIKHCLG